VITSGFADDALDLVRAKCLYALKVQAGEQPAPYGDRAATAYARSAMEHARQHCGARGRA
jgi:hypothetical protein